MGSNDVSTLGSNLDVLENGQDRIYVRGSAAGQFAMRIYRDHR